MLIYTIGETCDNATYRCEAQAPYYTLRVSIDQVTRGRNYDDNMTSSMTSDTIDLRLLFSKK
jgi:hypothetical protein